MVREHPLELAELEGVSSDEITGGGGEEPPAETQDDEPPVWLLTEPDVSAPIFLNATQDTAACYSLDMRILRIQAFDKALTVRAALCKFHNER